MTSPTPHKITRRKTSYGPFRDAEWTPTCVTCGIDLTPAPVDKHDADVITKRHSDAVAWGEVVTHGN